MNPLLQGLDVAATLCRVFLRLNTKGVRYRLTKICTLIVASHLLLIFFSVLNHILVNYAQRELRDRRGG